MSESGDEARGVREVTQGFTQRLPARVEKIVELWNSYSDEASLARFQAEVHKLKGTAATYGHKALAAILEEMERTLVEAKSGGIFKASTLAANIESGIEKLRKEEWRRTDADGAL